MKKIIKYSILLCFIGLFSTPAFAQKFAIKASGDIGLGDGMSLSTAFPTMTTTSSSTAFGVDFGYKFWQKNANSLELNIGLGYRTASAKFGLADFSYDYAASASADEDGNRYQRYTTLSGVEQKIDLGYLNIPIYLQYQYRVNQWLGIHADLGFGLGFKCSGKVGSTSGIASTYGVYPEYDQLVVKADYINDFGDTNLGEVAKGTPDVKGFSASLLAGAGLEFYVGGSVSVDLGVRYNAGLTDVFGGKYQVNSVSSITADNAPVTYTVVQGQQVKPLSDYVTKSRLSPLSLHIGVNIRF